LTEYARLKNGESKSWEIPTPGEPGYILKAIIKCTRVPITVDFKYKYEGEDDSKYTRIPALTSAYEVNKKTITFKTDQLRDWMKVTVTSSASGINVVTADIRVIKTTEAVSGLKADDTQIKKTIGGYTQIVYIDSGRVIAEDSEGSRTDSGKASVDDATVIQNAINQLA